MMRVVVTSTLFIVAALVACGDANGEAPIPPEEDSGPPPIDASVVDASDAAPGDADAGLAMCTDDGWCHVELPETRTWGVSPLRVVGLAFDGAGSPWAATTAFTIGDGTTTSHVIHYEDGTWKPRFGVGPLSSEPFLYELEGIASNGASSLVAVGGGTFSAPSRGPVVLRIQNGEVTAEYPALSHGFISVVFTSDTEVWALDDEGVVYRSDASVAGPMIWTPETVPHPPKPNSFSPGGPTALLRGTDGSLFVVSRVEGYYDSDINAWVPGYNYVDQRTTAGGTTVWKSSILEQDFRIQTGAGASASSLWLIASEFIVGSSASDGGSDGGLEWPYISKKMPIAMNAIWGRNPSDVWAVGPVGRIYHYDGTVWSDSAPELNGAPLTIEWLYAITGLPSGEMWAGGQNVVLHKTPGGGR